MSKKARYYSIAIVTLLLIICSSFPFALFIKDKYLLFFLQNGLRVAFLIFAFFYIKKNGLHRPLFSKISIKDILLFIPFLLIAFSNLIVVSINKSEAISFNAESFILSAISSILIAICEETVFRGVLLPEFRDNTTAFKSILYTSLIFGACHLLNISSVATILPCLVQAVYTAGIGFILGLVYLKSKNIILPILLHASFNIINNDLVTNLYNLNWDYIFYIVNVCVALLLALYWCYLFFFNKVIKKDLNSDLLP